MPPWQSPSRRRLIGAIGQARINSAPAAQQAVRVGMHAAPVTDCMLNVIARIVIAATVRPRFVLLTFRYCCRLAVAFPLALRNAGLAGCPLGATPPID